MQRDEALAGLNRLLGTLRYEGDDNREEIDAIKWALDRIAYLEDIPRQIVGLAQCAESSGATERATLLLKLAAAEQRIAEDWWRGLKDETERLDAMLNAAIEAAGLDPATATADDLIAWIRERRAEDWQDISTASKDGQDILLWEPRPDLGMPEYPGTVHIGSWDRDAFVDDQKDEIAANHWRPIPKGPQA